MGWSRRRVKAPIRTQRAVPCLQYVTQTGRIHKGGQDCRKEQLGIPCSPINAPPGPRNAPWWCDSIGKKLSVKADLAIYDQVLGVSG